MAVQKLTLAGRPGDTICAANLVSMGPCVWESKVSGKKPASRPPPVPKRTRQRKAHSHVLQLASKTPEPANTRGYARAVDSACGGDVTATQAPGGQINAVKHVYCVVMKLC